MGCSSCSTSTNGAPRGCKNNGTCGSDGCNKLTVFDWLANMSSPSGQEDFNGVAGHLKKTLEELNVENQDIDTIIGVVAPLSEHIVSK